MQVALERLECFFHLCELHVPRPQGRRLLVHPGRPVVPGQPGPQDVRSVAFNGFTPLVPLEGAGERRAVHLLADLWFADGNERRDPPRLLLQHRHPPQQPVAGQLGPALLRDHLMLQAVQSVRQRLEPSPPHRVLLRPALRALGQHEQFALPFQQLHAHPLVHLLPRLVQQVLLHLAQQMPGRADQIADPFVAHLLERRLGGDAPIHDPHAPGLAVERLDLRQEVLERGMVQRVAGEHLVRQRQAIGRHDQRDDHLAAIAPAVAAVAVPGLGDLPAAPLEVGAGEIVQQHVERSVEQRPPALDQVLAKIVLVRQHAIEAAIQSVLLGHGKVDAPEQLVHRAAQEPAAMHRELAARLAQAIDRK